MALRLPFVTKKTPTPQPSKKKKRKHEVRMHVGKRQKFVIAVLFLSCALFISSHFFGQYQLFIAPVLALLTDIFLLWSIYAELRENFTISVFILPFFYTLAFGLFSFIVPGRLIFQISLTIIYAIGMYSLYLSQNVFIVAAIRTIALLSGARIVSFVLTLLTYFFIANVILSLHIFIGFEILLILLVSYPMVYQSLWTYTLQKPPYSLAMWSIVITLIMAEVIMLLWFWPSSPTVLALFLTGFLYMLIGLSHIWLERRLFRGVLWEYVWVGAVVFFVLVSFTQWGK